MVRERERDKGRGVDDRDGRREGKRLRERIE